MFEFINLGYLAAGGAMVASPIIIHLINRLRYRRIRWAAMEFLLKSQKKNRRRLIIEQLILLFLRCLLIVLAVILVGRLLKFSLDLFGKHYEFKLGNTAQQKALHVVLLDDSLSMSDWVDDPKRPALTSCFEVAKDLISTEIAKNAGKSTTPQDLLLVPLSGLRGNAKQGPMALGKKRPGEPPSTWNDLSAKLNLNVGSKAHYYEGLADDATRDKLRKDVSRLKGTSLHVTLLDGLRLGQQVADAFKDDSQVIVHLVSDFRQRDWAAGEGKGLAKAVVQLAGGKTKINLIDTAWPYRTGAKSAPPRHDNVAITEFYPETRVVAANTYVRFYLTVHNFGPSTKEVRVTLWDPETGDPLQGFESGVSVKVPPGDYHSRIDGQVPSRATAGFLQISAKLEITKGDPATDDGVEADNIRHAAVYVRPKVPILIVDGDPRRGRQDGGDSRHISTALAATWGGGYEIEPDPDKDDLAGGVDLLDQPNLERFPTIFLVNVPSLSPDQRRNLENYVRGGGSVAIFLGPLVDAQFYNESLYQNGRGLLPVELEETYYPPRDKPPMQPNLDDDHFKVLLRKDLFPVQDKYPIFGAIVESKNMEESFKYLPIYRYYRLKNLTTWDPKRLGVDELATMPNLYPVKTYSAAAGKIKDQLTNLMDDSRFDAFSRALNDYRKKINKALEPDKRGKDKGCYELADVLGKLLTDQGDEDPTKPRPPGAKGPERPSLVRLWNMKDNENLKLEIASLYKQVRYGDPLVVGSRFGQGRVVVVTTTAGRAWNAWPAQPSYVPMVLEMQSYLTSLGSQSKLTVGGKLRLDLGKDVYDRKVKRVYFQPWLEREVAGPKRRGARPDQGPQFGQDRKADLQIADYTAEQDPKTGRSFLEVTDALQPGFYRFDLTRKGERGKQAVEERGYFLNVDTENEGNLQRVARELLDKDLEGAPAETVKMYGPFDWGTALIDRQTDFSESPWFYLIFMMILVAEQALAVHLSFHLRDTEATLPTQVLRSQALTS
jgi:hypothetical protein